MLRMAAATAGFRSWSLPAAMLYPASTAARVGFLPRAKASTNASSRAVRVTVVVICAYFLFDQRLDAATAIGAGLIVSANVYIARREARLARGADA